MLTSHQPPDAGDIVTLSVEGRRVARVQELPDGRFRVVNLAAHHAAVLADRAEAVGRAGRIARMMNAGARRACGCEGGRA